jgi:hypothetical protein
MEYNMSIDELNRKKNNLIVEKMKMDKFFSMFLEKFERKMDSDNTNTPIWKLYKSKLKEYEKIDQEIKTTNYWINKEQNV